MSRDFMAVFLHLMFLNEKYSVIGFRSFLLNYTYIHDAVLLLIV